MTEYDTMIKMVAPELYTQKGPITETELKERLFEQEAILRRIAPDYIPPNKPTTEEEIKQRIIG